MNADLRRLYVHHALTSVGISFMLSDAFSTTLFMRLGLSTSQYGTIYGLGMGVAPVFNVLLAPYILRARIDRGVVAAMGIVRAVLAVALLLLPYITRDIAVLTVGFSIIYTLFMACPSVGNNSLAALIRVHVPSETLGRHAAVMLWLWDFPMRLTLIVCSYFVGKTILGDDATFFRTHWWLLLVTIAFLIPAGWTVMKLSPSPPATEEELAPARLSEVLTPFRDAAFRPVAVMLFALTIVSSMVMMFFFQFMSEARGWSIFAYSIVGALMSGLGFLLAPMWGRLADRVGGKNVLSFGALGVGVSLLLLNSNAAWAIMLFAALAWSTNMGLAGTALNVGQRYLSLSSGPASKINIYLAALTLVTGAGYLVGSIGGGWMLDWLRSFFAETDKNSHFQIYFVICAVLFLFTAQFIRTLRDERRRFSAVEVVYEIYHEVRGRADKAG